MNGGHLLLKDNSIRVREKKKEIATQKPTINFILLGPDPERPIGANPGLRFCSTFCIYLPMHCLK